MSQDREDARRLDELSKRIEAAKARRAPKPARADGHGQAEVAWRMVIELVAGIAIGTGIGYGLDVLLDTQPWFLILFCLLGFAAGVNVMMRTAGELNGASGPGAAGGADETAPDGAEDETAPRGAGDGGARPPKDNGP